MTSAIARAPYQEILPSLVGSIMAAQAELLAFRDAAGSVAKAPDRQINRHFCWLATIYHEGENRHLFDSIEGSFPIRTGHLRNRAGLPEAVAKILDARLPLPVEPHQVVDGSDEVLAFVRKTQIVQKRPTRISRLVKASFEEVNLDITSRGQDFKRRRGDIFLKSPLAIALDFLTIPDIPGSRAYPSLTIRNYIFEVFGIMPDGLADFPSSRTFSVEDVEAALSHIWTSFRPRYWSSGEDTLSARGRSSASGLLRHLLGAKGVLWLRFKDQAACAAFLNRRQLDYPNAPYEFSRAASLERLPDLGELINELWGLPIPIRGADTIFRGGLKFSSRRGLVLGLHGGPGTGKTSLALALGAFLAPFDITTIFITAEETAEDLRIKATALVPDEVRRLSFFPKKVSDWLQIQDFELTANPQDEGDVLASLSNALDHLAVALRRSADLIEGAVAPPKPCRAVVVLDGVHDLLLATSKSKDDISLLTRLRDFIVKCKELQALVVLTSGEDWAGDKALDYLVDVAMRVSYDSVGQYGKKPDRRIALTKARHQLCSIGVHGIQIAGAKGVRFSPQINYQLDRRAMWRTRIPDMTITKPALVRALSWSNYQRLGLFEDEGRWPESLKFHDSPNGVQLFRGANIFLNGEGSGAKAALAMKIAISPSFSTQGLEIPEWSKVLVVSFLYPKDYYEKITEKLTRLRRLEYPDLQRMRDPALTVIHLYPGNYAPDQLFNRIEWELDSAQLQGAPFTSIVIDGIHNVFLQFPEIENYTLFWPQLYAALRARPVTIISTHTTFVLQGASETDGYRLDDKRSEPLRHALVQKTDFRFEIDPVSGDDVSHARADPGDNRSNIFSIRAVAAINQPIPKEDVLWSRERLVLIERDQARLL